jgi:O-antigen/teichoic acid export membrane protein
MPDFNEWGRVVPDLMVGATGGVIGAIAREMYRTDRELTWALVGKILCAVPVGMLAVSAASAIGFDDPRAIVAIAIASGMLGQAVMIDAMRSLLRAWLTRQSP